MLYKTLFHKKIKDNLKITLKDKFYNNYKLLHQIIQDRFIHHNPKHKWATDLKINDRLGDREM